LALGEVNQLHLTFEKRSLPDNVFSSALYYTRSSGSGVSWSEPALVENGASPNGRVVWSDLATAGEWVVHRAWQEHDGLLSHLWHQISTDGGSTWSRAVRLGGFFEQVYPATLITDAAGHVFLLAVQEQEAAGGGQVFLEQWQWLSESYRWETMENLGLEGAPAEWNSGELAAAIGAAQSGNGVLNGALDGRLAVLLSNHRENPAGSSLLFTGRLLSAVVTQPLSAVTMTPPPRQTTPPPATSPPQSTATPQFPVEPEHNRFNIDFLPVPGGNMLVLGALLALIPTAFIIVLVVIRRGRFRPHR
jgi:hypothetical protein